MSLKSALSAPAIGRRVQSRPWLFFGGAVASGYLLGGGLGSQLGKRLLRIGGLAAWRFFVVPRLEETIHNVLHGRDHDKEG